MSFFSPRNFRETWNCLPVSLLAFYSFLFSAIQVTGVGHLPFQQPQLFAKQEVIAQNLHQVLKDIPNFFCRYGSPLWDAERKKEGC
jgi:hypothetical protein